MSNWWKSKTAKDRWEILRMTHWAYGNSERSRGGVRETKLQCRNKYSGKTKEFILYGEYYFEDFPNGTYSGKG